MNIKRTLWLTLCLSSAVMATAQVQQGYVRTINRPDRQPVPVANVTLNISGAPNAVLTNAEGVFSFSCTSQSYRIMRVQKQGYQLIDKDVIGRQQPFSPAVRQEIVMVAQEDLEADKRRIEDKAYARAQADYEKRLAEIQQQLAAQEITEQQAAQAEVALGDNYQKYVEMIGDMAERYATMDYEGISDLNRQILQCIENAELEKADSLINTKGSMEQRLQEIREQQQANQQTREFLEQSEKSLAFKVNDLAEDCYSKYTIFESRYQNDSAAYYLEQRAALDTTNVKWQNQAGRFVDDRMGDYPLALSYYQRVLRQSLLQFGEESNWTALSYNNIGGAYYSQGDYAKALECFQKALVIWEKVFGLEHPDVARSYNNIGLVYDFQGDYAKALEYYQKALVIREKVFGLSHPYVAQSWHNIGFVYGEQGDYEKALEYYQKALVIREKVLGLEHPDVAESYINIGAVYDNQGDCAKAMEYYQKSLVIREKVFGLNHPDVAQSYNNIGFVYYNSLGDYEKALEYYQKALSICEKMLGSEHPYVATSYNNIGSIYCDRGDYTKAVEYYQKSLFIREKVFGPEHPNVATSYNNIGFVYKSQGDYAKALEYYQKAFAIFEKMLGLEHPNTKKVRENIEDVQQKMSEE